MPDPERPALSRISTAIVLLAIVTLVLGGTIWSICDQPPHTHRPPPPTRQQARATAMHGVYEGKSGQAAIDAARAQASDAERAAGAYGGTTSGKAIYAHLCHTCHTTGIAGAPRLGDRSAWAPRIARGMHTLIAHALHGYTGANGNRMPAKGGNPELSRTQIANTVRWMVKQSH